MSETSESKTVQDRVLRVIVVEQVIGPETANLGLAALISLYLIRWMTSKLNGKLDKLVQSQEKLMKSQEELKQSIEKLTERIEKLT